jgi:hypothetical protein
MNSFHTDTLPKHKKYDDKSSIDLTIFNTKDDKSSSIDLKIFDTDDCKSSDPDGYCHHIENMSISIQIFSIFIISLIILIKLYKFMIRFSY